MRHNQQGQFVIHPGGNRTILLHSWDDIYGYITQLSPENIDKLIRMIYPKASPGFGINNLFARLFIAHQIT